MPEPAALIRVTASVPVGMEGQHLRSAPGGARAQRKKAGLAADQGIMRKVNSSHSTTAEQGEHTANRASRGTEAEGSADTSMQDPPCPGGRAVRSAKSSQKHAGGLAQCPS